MKPGQISVYHLWSGSFGLLVVAAFYSFPRSVAAQVFTAAPWAMLLAGVAVSLILLPTVLTLAGRTGQGLIDLAIQGGGRPLAVAVALLISAFSITSTGLSLRQASELAVTALFPHTPQTFAMSSMILASAVGAAMAPANAFWVASIFAWPALFSVLLLAVGSVAWGQFRNAMPPTGPGVLPVLMEVPALASYFSPLIHFLTFAGLTTPTRGLLRGVLTTAGATAVTWALVLLFYLMVFPLPGGLGIPFPVFEMSRLVEGGRFLERVDAIWILIWVFGSVLRSAISLLGSTWLIKEAFGLPDHRGAVLPLAVSSLSIALFPSNLSDAIAVEGFLFREISYLVFFLLPLLVTILAWVRQRRGGEFSG